MRRVSASIWLRWKIDIFCMENRNIFRFLSFFWLWLREIHRKVIHNRLEEFCWFYRLWLCYIMVDINMALGSMIRCIFIRQMKGEVFGQNKIVTKF